MAAGIRASAKRNAEYPNGGRVRVLHVIQNLNYGGMERLLADLVQRIDSRRFESHVLVLQFRGRFATEMEGYAVVHQGPPQSRLSMLRPTRLAQVIGEIAPDIVHSHSGVWYKTSLASRLAGVPRLIHTDHGRQIPDPWRARVVDRLASRRTDCVVAVSEALGTYLKEAIVVDAQRVVVVLNGVDTTSYRPRADTGRIRADLGIPEGAPIIGSIGRLEPIKGYEVMVRALAHLGWRTAAGLAPHLLIAGDGSERARLKALAAELGVVNRVHLPGWRDDVADLHSAFTIFAMASWSEGTSISLLEAMSAGRCPVVTRVGGNPGVLGVELAHRLVPPGDPLSMAQAWTHALHDDRLRLKDADSARTRIQSAYSLDAMVQAYETLYASSHVAMKEKTRQLSSLLDGDSVG